MRLDSRRTLILGGGGAGIGRAVARAYAVAGASVAVADIDPSRAEDAAAEVRATGSVGHAITGDVRSAQEIEAMVEKAVDALGGWTPW